MKNLITAENFDSKKVEILNSVSTFGAINHPNTWAYGLHIFEFSNENVDCMVTSFLINSYKNQI